MKKIISVISASITAATVFVFLSAAVFVAPRAAGIVPYIVKSGSMEPVISTGAAAFINTKDTDAEPGDIITYCLGSESGKETLVTHRVVGIKDGMYVTKGDANDVEDMSLVEEDQIIGTYLFQLPKAGYFLAWLERKRLIAAAFWILLLNGISMALHFAFSEDSSG